MSLPAAERTHTARGKGDPGDINIEKGGSVLPVFCDISDFADRCSRSPEV